MSPHTTSPPGRRQPSPAVKPARRACTGSAPSPARARSVRTPRPPGSRDSSRHCARLWTREARRTGESHHHVIQTHTREDRDSIPRRLAVNCDGVPATSELVAEQVEERIVCELGLLQADHVRPPLVQPGSSRGTRCLTELTFQVAIRTGATLPAPPTAAAHPTRRPLDRSPGVRRKRPALQESVNEMIPTPRAKGGRPR
jgi:hypothetical protein